MSKVRKDLLNEIDAKIAKKKALRQEVAKRRDDIEAYVVGLMGELEDISIATVNTEYYETIVHMYSSAIYMGVRQNYDCDATVEVVWGDTAEGQPKRLSGVLIKWSKEYQALNNCEPERFVDIVNLLLK